MNFFTPIKATKLLVVFCVFFLLISFAYSKKTPVNALQTISTSYKQSLHQLQNSIAVFNGQIQQLTPKTSIEPAQASFLEVRKNFKNVEFLLEYLDAQNVKDYVNGAPLPKIERSSAQVNTIEPHGMQVIEELLFAENSIENSAQLKLEADLLLQKFTQINLFQQTVVITERNLFEAARQQLIRIITLGITGFDTPASNNALVDAKNSLLPLQKMVELYKPQLDKDLAKQLSSTIDGAINYLEKNTDFDSFNRFEFIKNYINPAFGFFLKAQKQLGIETLNEVSNIKQPLNPNAQDIFSTTLFNADYFSTANDAAPNPDKIMLGKMLFFDPILSQNNKRSCASCHNPQKAFTDGQEKSLAIDFNGNVGRNAPTLINSIFADRFFYDLRTEKIENQFEHVILSPLEFNTTYPQIVERLQKSSQYKQLFAKAFPNYNNQLQKENITEAIGAYLKTLVSFNSEFDKNIRNQKQTLSPQVINGFNLFMGKAACATCHFAPTFSGLVPPAFIENESEVLGVPATKDTINAVIDPDVGRIGGRMKERVAFNQFSFKTTTIRNAALTAPYMHNGVFTTLDEVMDFYDRGGGAGIGIHLQNQTLSSDRLNLTNNEKQDIIAFIKSLTDTAGLTSIPLALPIFEGNDTLNQRKIGGEY